MENNFSKAFFGYNKEEVYKALDNLDDEFNSLMTQYKNKEDGLNKEIVQLTNELNKLTLKTKDSSYLHDELTQILYNSQISSSELIYNEEKNLDDMLIHKNKVINELEMISERINMDISQLMNKITELINKASENK